MIFFFRPVVGFNIIVNLSNACVQYSVSVKVRLKFGHWSNYNDV